MEFVLSVLSAGILCYLAGCLSLKRDYIKCFVMGLSFFFCEYVVLSGILFVFDAFYISRTLWILLVVNLILLVLIRRKHPFHVEPLQFKKHSIFLIVFVLLIPIYLSGNGFFGMGQDQGVYQTKALFLMKDKTAKQIYYDSELELLDSEEDKKAFVDDVFRYPGDDRYDTRFWFNTEEDKVNDTAGIFHGVQTFPALMAWSGTLFGVENMMLCQMFFLFLYLAVISFLCDEITSRLWVKVPALVMIGFSPIVLWVAKAALTEMFLALLFVLFFYFLQEGKGKKIWYTLIPLVTYSFYHVTIYTMMPLFVCIYLLYFLKSGEKRYLYVSMANVLGFLAGFFAMLRVNPVYTENNYFNGIGFLSFLTLENLPIFVCIVCVIVLLAHFLMLLIKKPKEEWLNHFLGSPVFKIGFMGILVLFALVILKRMDCPFQNLNIVGYAMMSGVITLPVIGGLFLWKLFREKDFLTDTFGFVIFFGFFYTVILYSAVFRVEIRHYFYFARYLVPYIALIALTFVYLAEKVKWPFLAFIAVFAGSFYTKYDALLYAEPDDTRLTWETLMGILDNIEDEGKTAVLVDYDVGITYRLAVKGWTNADTYLIHDENDLLDKLALAEDEYEKLYYIAQKENVDFGGRIFYERVRLKNVACEDLGLYGNTTRLPVKFVKTETSEILYEMETPRYNYPMSWEADPFPVFGFSGIEETFAWVNEKEAGVECNFRKGNYTMTVVQGPGIPFEQLQRELPLEIYFNDHLAGSYQLSEATNEETFSMKIPEEWVEDGSNYVTFKMNEMWSPLEIGADDDRQLGFSLSKLIFEKD